MRDRRRLFLWDFSNQVRQEMRTIICTAKINLVSAFLLGGLLLINIPEVFAQEITTAEAVAEASTEGPSCFDSIQSAVGGWVVNNGLYQVDSLYCTIRYANMTPEQLAQLLKSQTQGQAMVNAMIGAYVKRCWGQRADSPPPGSKPVNRDPRGPVKVTPPGYSKFCQDFLKKLKCQLGKKLCVPKPNICPIIWQRWEDSVLDVIATMNNDALNDYLESIGVDTSDPNLKVKDCSRYMGLPGDQLVALAKAFQPACKPNCDGNGNEQPKPK